MSNVVDYVKWRGDLPFSKVPLNVIDNLVLAQLSYIDFRGVLTEQSKGYTLAICKGLNGRLLLELSLNTKECISATAVLTMVFKWFRAIRRQGFKTLSYDYIRVIDTDGYLRLYNEKSTPVFL